MDKKLTGGYEAGDNAGVKKGGDDEGETGEVGKNCESLLDDEFGCKICGKLSKNQTEHNKHLHESHSMSAINLSKEVLHNNSKLNMNLKGCTECERSFFFSDTLGLHMNKYHKDAY